MKIILQYKYTLLQCDFFMNTKYIPTLDFFLTSPVYRYPKLDSLK